MQRYDPDFPTEFLEAVRYVAGDEGVRAVIASRGGRTAYIPSARALRPDHWFALAIGFECARRVCAGLEYSSGGGRTDNIACSSGNRISVPMNDPADSGRRTPSVMQALSEGKSVTYVAALAGVHERTVYRWRRRLRMLAALSNANKQD